MRNDTNFYDRSGFLKLNVNLVEIFPNGQNVGLKLKNKMHKTALLSNKSASYHTISIMKVTI